MTAAAFPRRAFPCNECPWRRDTPPGQFPASRYAALADTSGRESTFGAPLFGCHKGTPGAEEDDLACAGWLAVEGANHLAVRLALAAGRLDRTAVEPQPDWPPLFDSYAAMAAAQGRPDR